MNYSTMLAKAVNESGWSYTEIVRRCERRGQKLTKSYLCHLVRGSKPPASDKVNRALAETLAPFAEFTYEQLRMAAYKDGIPQDVLNAIIAEAVNSHTAIAM